MTVPVQKSKVHIRQLRCRVIVKTGAREMPVAHHPAGPGRPSLNFALPPAEPHVEVAQPEPTQTIAEHSTSEAAPKQNAAKKTDPRIVADRVYELMKQEIALSRQRGGSRRTG